MVDVTKLSAAIEAVRYNPIAIQREVYALQKDVREGRLQFVDPTNPFSLLLESCAVMTSAGISEAEAINRKRYPSMALDAEELYLHMADVDHLSRFAQPSRTSFSILLGKEELYQRAVDTGVNGMRKLVIPRNSEFSVAGYKFTLQYPIELRVMGHGGLQVVYDATQPSPLQVLESNVVSWGVSNIGGVDYIRLDFPVSQFEIKPYYSQLSTTQPFSKIYSFTDQYYYCRVYHARAGGDWVELRTTHTDQVYDPLVPTAVLKVLDGKVQVTVPQVYFSTQQMGTDIRIDIHTTKGPIDLILSNYVLNNFTTRWVDLAGGDGLYSAPLGVFSTMAVFSEHTVTGGGNGLTFLELRDRVMGNALGAVKIPITNAQLTNALSDKGYKLVKDIDNITNRVFFASRGLPTPKVGQAVTPAGCMIQMFETTVNSLKNHGMVKQNGPRITLMPDALYRLNDGIIDILDVGELTSLKNLPLEIRANAVTRDRLLFTPFHYVLDSLGSTFQLRPYDLTTPKVISKYFVEENGTVQLEVSTIEYEFTKTPSGWRLLIRTKSGDTFKQLVDDDIHVRLSYLPPLESDRAYVDGTLVTKDAGERIYQFDLGTNFDIDHNDHLKLDTLTMYGETGRPFNAKLEQDFDLVYSVTNYTVDGMRRSNIDDLIDYPTPTSEAVGIVQEGFKLRFGESLKGLWSNSRSVVGSQGVAYYEEDVPWIHTENQYKRDPVSGALQLTVLEDGSLEYELLHSKGDPVLNTETGEPVMQWFKGQVKQDPFTGLPLLKDDRDMLRQLDMFFVDGLYYFATDASSIDYRNSVVQQVSNWVVGDIPELTKGLLEQTELFFYPSRTFGMVEAVIEEGLEIPVDSEQSFRVDYYVTRGVYNNGPLRQEMTRAAIETIEEGLKRVTVSMSDIASVLKVKSGDDLIAVEVWGLGGDLNYRTLTVKDASGRCTIKKRLTILSDESLAVKDAVDVNFILHLPDTL